MQVEMLKIGMQTDLTEMMEKLNSEKEEIVHANSLVLIKGEEYGSVR